MQNRYAKIVLKFIAATTLCLVCTAHTSAEEQNTPKPDFELDQASANTLAAKIDELVSTKFLDKSKVDKIWRPGFDTDRTVFGSQSNLLSFAAKMNELLSMLHTSHTQLLTENDEAFYFMRSLFGAFKKDEKDPNKNDADFTGLGVGGGHAEPGQVRYVLDDSPAAKAGFQRGDKISSVNGRAYTGYAVWYQTSGKPCDVWVERQGKKVELKITPVKQDFLKGYLTATEKSAKVIPQAGKKIGYLHFWSGGVGTHDAMEDALTHELMNTDSLVLDLRDGYGGASLNDIDIFFRPRSAYPDMQSRDRKGKRFERSIYDKPVAVLINRGTRSGKELMAFGLKRSKRGVLIGENTAGYVVGGEFNPIDRRTILYLAIIDISLDGQRIEGKGVAPDIAVTDKLGAEDPVLQKALTYLSKSIPAGVHSASKLR